MNRKLALLMGALSVTSLCSALELRFVNRSNHEVKVVFYHLDKTVQDQFTIQPGAKVSRTISAGVDYYFRGEVMGQTVGGAPYRAGTVTYVLHSRAFLPVDIAISYAPHVRGRFGGVPLFDTPYNPRTLLTTPLLDPLR